MIQWLVQECLIRNCLKLYSWNAGILLLTTEDQKASASTLSNIKIGWQNGGYFGRWIWSALVIRNGSPERLNFSANFRDSYGELMPKLLEVSPHIGNFKESEKARNAAVYGAWMHATRVERENLEKITATPAITSNAVTAKPPNSPPSWLRCYIHLLPYLPLWLRIYCFKLNFWTIFQLNIPSFEKSIFRSFFRHKIYILTHSCCRFPSGTGFHYFLWFSTIFLIFLIFSSMNKLHDSK